MFAHELWGGAGSNNCLVCAINHEHALQAVSRSTSVVQLESNGADTNRRRNRQLLLELFPVQKYAVRWR